MSDEEYDDELPSISVHSTSRNSAEWVMPSAGAVASEREREQATERELQLLRLRHEEAPLVARPLHSDSSGSESEALAAAVTALQVHAARAPAADGDSCAARHAGRADAIELLAALCAQRAHAEDRLLTRYQAAMRASPRTAHAVTDDLVRRISNVIADEASEWSESEAVSCAGALCAAAMARGAGGARRALHALLDGPCGVHVRVVSRALSAAPRLRLRVADLARSGARAGADVLADALVADALAHLLQSEIATEADPLSSALSLVSSGAAPWRGLSSSERYSLLQLCGRALSASPPPSRAAPLRALADLAQPAAKDKHQPDHLKVIVAAKRLQLLFRADPACV